MTHLFRAFAVLALLALAWPLAAHAGDFDPSAYRGYGTGLKDSYGARTSRCYLRGDVGYSVSSDPDARSALANSVFGTGLDNTWLAGAGVGCGSGPQGLRAEAMFDYRGDRDFAATLSGGGGTVATSVQTSTLMLNAYYDLGTWSRVVPYIGAGIGMARNAVDPVAYSALATSPVAGDDRWSFAWSLMAGFGWQVSDRAVLDFGYRYLDAGTARSGTIDSAGGAQPRLTLDDLTSHEFKIGLRYHFGG
jgi:opacity protein-like surface antigen